MLRSKRGAVVRQQLLMVIALWVAVLASALMVIYVTHDTRLKFNDLETLRHQQDALQVEWGQYLLEESAWASYGRVEKIAADKLSMKVPSTEQIIMVNADEG